MTDTEKRGQDSPRRGPMGARKQFTPEFKREAGQLCLSQMREEGRFKLKIIRQTAVEFRFRDGAEAGFVRK